MTTGTAFVIYGAGGQAASVADAIRASRNEVVAYVDDLSSALPELDAPVYRQLPLDLLTAGTAVVLAVGDNVQRAQLWERIRAEFPALETKAVIHPSATISSNASIAEGAVVLAGSIIGPRTTVGRFALINNGAVVDHDCTLLEFSSVGPGAILGGGVTVGARAVVAIGSVVREKTCVGHDAILGAASYLHDDLDPETIAYGSPARIVRKRMLDEPYMR